MDGIKLIIIFLVILFLLIRKQQLAVAMLVAIGLLGLFYTIPLPQFLLSVYHGFIDADTIEFVLAIVFIMFLEKIFNEQGYRSRLLSSLSGLFHSRRLTIAAIPAFIGLIPSAGGAVFSAPMVEEACRGVQVAPIDQAFCTSYYRHVWEVSLPTFPGVLIAIQLSGLSLNTFILAMLPFSLLIIFIVNAFLMLI